MDRTWNSWRAVALDVPPGMLEAARLRAPGPLVAGDMVALPVTTASFDVVLAAHTLAHVEDREAAAREMRWALRPDGVLGAVATGESSHREMLELVEEVVGHDRRWSRPSDVACSLEHGTARLRIGPNRSRGSTARRKS